MFATRIAAGEAGIYAYDGAFADIRDAEGFRAEATLSRRLGYLGKTCIHPSQIAIANEVFAPTAEEIAAAHDAIAVYRASEADGVGAIGRDGKLVDAAHMRLAENVLHKASLR